MTDQDALIAVVLGGARAAGWGDAGALDVAIDRLAIAAGTDRTDGSSGSSGSSGTDGTSGVGTAVAKVFTTVVGAMWERGWQPAEAARAVRRPLGGRHGEVAAAAIAGEAADAGRVGAPPQWTAQLEELGASRWWGDGPDWLAPWAQRSGVEWIVALGLALEALGVLLRLPALEQLLPPPSAWGDPTWRSKAGWGQAASGPGARGAGARGPGARGARDDPMLAKIRALLAKAESTSFEAEAEALTAKAQELMSRHSIDDLLARGAPGHRQHLPGARRIPVDDPYADAKSSLLSTVASANGVRCVWHPDLALMTVVGYDADLDGLDAIFTSLLVQATRRMVAERPEPDRWGRSQTRSFRRSFLLSFAVRIGERLAEAANHTRLVAEEELSVSLLPALSRRQDEVDEALSEMFPRLTRHRSRSASNREGWAAGRQAADQARLDGDRARIARASSG